MGLARVLHDGPHPVAVDGGHHLGGAAETVQEACIGNRKGIDAILEVTSKRMVKTQKPLFSLLGKRRVDRIHKVRVQGQQLFTHSSLGHETATSKKLPLSGYLRI